MNDKIKAAEEYVAGMNRYRDRCAAAASERAPSEPAGPAQVVAAVATCSLPASSAEALIESWKADAVRTTSDPYRAGLMRCAVELRREMARATERQPEENSRDEPRGGP